MSYYWYFGLNLLSAESLIRGPIELLNIQINMGCSWFFPFNLNRKCGLGRLGYDLRNSRVTKPQWIPSWFSEIKWFDFTYLIKWNWSSRTYFCWKALGVQTSEGQHWLVEVLTSYFHQISSEAKTVVFTNLWHFLMFQLELFFVRHYWFIICKAEGSNEACQSSTAHFNYN